MPIISVIIPTYNRPKELERALRSAVAQTEEDIEIIVVDDGMQVRGEEVVRGLGDPRVRYMAQEVSRGSSAARNIGIRAASGEYVAFLDDTDEWAPEKLETQHQAFAESPDSVMAVVSGGKRVGDRGEERTKIVPGIFGLSEHMLRNLKAALMSAQMVRRSVFDDIGYFDESLPSHQDMDIIFRIGEKHPIRFLSDDLARFHSGHTERTGEGLEGIDRRIRGREVLLQKHEERMSEYPDIYGWHYFTLGLWYRDAGKHAQAAESFFRAFDLSKNPRYLAHALIAYLQSKMV